MVFGYFKKYPNKRIVVDSRDPIITGGYLIHYYKLVEDFKEEYLETMEEIDEDLPPPLIDELAITVFVDSENAHDKVIHQSITGIIMLVSRTPVSYYNKLQGSVETPTYSSEFMEMDHAVEEIDDYIPPPLVDKIAVTVFVDSVHSHEKVTRRSQ